jgi:hypothetical protein
MHRPSTIPFDSVIRIERHPMLPYIVISNEAHHTDGAQRSIPDDDKLHVLDSSIRTANHYLLVAELHRHGILFGCR